MYLAWHPLKAMIHIDKVVGNINSDSNLKDKYELMLKNDHVERIEITRLEAERSRMRKVSDRGTDLALTLIPGSHINDGDVLLLTEKKLVIAKRIVESVAVISLMSNVSPDQLFDTAIKVGHTIGNMHRPIKVTNGKIYLPIQSESEIELFQKLFSKLGDFDIKHENIIFDPEPGYDIHGH